MNFSESLWRSRSEVIRCLGLIVINNDPVGLWGTWKYVFDVCGLCGSLFLCLMGASIGDGRFFGD